MLEFIGKFFIGVALTVLNILLTGVVVADLWSWFIMPIFNIGAITIVQAIGLSFTVGFLCKYVPLHQKETEENSYSLLERSVIGISYILIVWGIGALYHVGLGG